MPELTIDEEVLCALQRRAEQMARGQVSDLGQALCDIPAVEDLRRAIDMRSFPKRRYSNPWSK